MMRIAVTGSSGLIGSALVNHLRSLGHEVRRFVRREPHAADEISWDPERKLIDVKTIEGLDGIIHLAGASIAARRWSRSYKQLIRSSRIDSTQLLVEALQKTASPPRFFLCASAIGYFGDRGEEVLTEASPRGKGFLAAVVEEWETTARYAEEYGVRVVNLRFGQVLARHGGVVASLLPVFRLGLGGPIGQGLAWWSWILLEDVCRAVEFLLDHAEIRGPVNITSPNPVRNRDFTKAFAKAIHRPAVLRVPTLLLKLLFGQLAQEVLLASARVIPVRLQESGFSFAYADIDKAFAKIFETVL